jgi:hypothetical protein
MGIFAGDINSRDSKHNCLTSAPDHPNIIDLKIFNIFLHEAFEPIILRMVLQIYGIYPEYI